MCARIGFELDENRASVCVLRRGARTILEYFAVITSELCERAFMYVCYSYDSRAVVELCENRERVSLARFSSILL